ncbi:MAG TPA: phosphate ABC transporter substrate-binding protein [Methanotrichaceae archaeon]|nr:phosphate ABC transporter substrate-binding protein [Methanotrichaceae archaeon]
MHFKSLYEHGGTITINAVSIIIIISIMVVSSSAAVEKVVTVSGSTALLPLIAVAAETFNDQQEEYFVTVTGGGTGPGIVNIAERKEDIAMASRELTEEEKIRYGNRFQEYLIGYGDVVIAVSSAIYDAGVTDLTGEQVKNIYLGKITNWRDVGGPEEDIYAIARATGSGTRETFNEVILGDVNAETSGVSTNAFSDAEVKTAIEGSDKAIGYLGLIYLQRGNIKPIALDGVVPDIESLRNGSYILTRKLYLYTYGGPTPGAKKFIEFLLGAEGQKIVEETGFTPLDYAAA